MSGARRTQGRGPWRPARAILLVLLALPILPRPALAHPGLDEQIRDLTDRIERHPGDATLYLKRGDVHREHGDRRRARSDYRQARRLDPALDVVDLRLGALHLDAGEHRRALAAADHFLSGRVDDPRGLRLRARALEALGRHLEAADALQRLIAATTPPLQASPDDYLDRARAFTRAGPAYRDRAIQALDDGVEALGPIVSLELPAIALEVEAGRYEAALRRIEALPEEARGCSLGGLEASLRAARRGAGRTEDAPPAPPPTGGR